MASYFARAGQNLRVGEGGDLIFDEDDDEDAVVVEGIFSQVRMKGPPSRYRKGMSGSGI
jgi:hypothetical protein